jgi:hypothetical protein
VLLLLLWTVVNCVLGQYYTLCALSVPDGTVIAEFFFKY